MLRKPDLPDERITAYLREEYGLQARDIAFLPLGADADTAVYRVVTEDEMPYFLKLRRRTGFAETAVEIPHFLHEQTIAPIIAPLTTSAGRLWTPLEDFAAILSPFIAGSDGFTVSLSDRQWVELGAALRSTHAVHLPEWLGDALPHESYSSYWRDRVREFQERAEGETFADPVAARLATFLQSRRDIVTGLLRRADALAGTLRRTPPSCVLCHGDIHAWNVLIGEDGTLHIVDWDTVILAPRERDLMFIGAGIGGIWDSPSEATLFYEGYGPVEIDPVALAYYRYERIVEDIAAFCEELLLGNDGSAERDASLQMLVGQFEPNSVVEIAYRSDPSIDVQ